MDGRPDFRQEPYVVARQAGFSRGGRILRQEDWGVNGKGAAAIRFLLDGIVGTAPAGSPGAEPLEATVAAGE